MAEKHKEKKNNNINQTQDTMSLLTPSMQTEIGSKRSFLDKPKGLSFDLALTKAGGFGTLKLSHTHFHRPLPNLCNPNSAHSVRVQRLPVLLPNLPGALPRLHLPPRHPQVRPH